MTERRRKCTRARCRPARDGGDTCRPRRAPPRAGRERSGAGGGALRVACGAAPRYAGQRDAAAGNGRCCRVRGAPLGAGSGHWARRGAGLEAGGVRYRRAAGSAWQGQRQGWGPGLGPGPARDWDLDQGWVMSGLAFGSTSEFGVESVDLHPGLCVDFNLDLCLDLDHGWTMCESALGSRSRFRSGFGSGFGSTSGFAFGAGFRSSSGSASGTHVLCSGWG